MMLEKAFRKAGITILQIGQNIGIPNLDPESGRIFITGGSGVIGHRVAIRLLRAGYPSVRLAARDPSTLSELNKMGAEIAYFDWENEASYAKALKGVKTVLCTIPYVEHWERHFVDFLKACLKAGVRHFVKISFYHARSHHDTVFRKAPIVRSNGACDRILIKTLSAVRSPHLGNGTVGMTEVAPRMSYTILYASHFMSNPFTYQNNELRAKDTDLPPRFYGASGYRGVNYVSPNDVAEAATRVILEPRAHFKREYTLTGPAPVTDLDVAELLSQHLHKDVLYIDQPLRDFADNLRIGGVPRWVVGDLKALEYIKATGKEESRHFYSEDFYEICGHRPEPFSAYLRNQDMMTPIEKGVEDELKPLKPLLPS